MLSASAFGSADNTYLDLDYSGYHKNLIQYIVYYLTIKAFEDPEVSSEELSVTRWFSTCKLNSYLAIIVFKTN